MRKLLSSILFGLALCVGITSPAAAQGTGLNRPWFFAADFGQWSIPGQTANSYQFSPGSLCFASAGGVNFFTFATNAPVYVRDTVAANSEVLTPSAIIKNQGTCGVAIVPSNQHFSFSLQSGTAGLQEALNALAVSANTVPALIYLDRYWYTLALAVPGKTPAGIINAAAGNAGAVLVDSTTSPFTYYAWNGTKYAVVSGVNGGRAVPTAAATAGAGTGATIAASGNGSVINVNLTSGTGTATGSIFTLNWANSGASSDTYDHAPACTVTSIGTNTPAGTVTVATTYGSSHATATVSIATTALTASTAYVFRVSCQ